MPSMKLAVALVMAMPLQAADSSLRCEQYLMPHTWAYCTVVQQAVADWEADAKQATARGRQPVPSRQVVTLPALGTPDSQVLGWPVKARRLSESCPQGGRRSTTAKGTG